jgi:hypothetical protein
MNYSIERTASTDVINLIAEKERAKGLLDVKVEEDHNKHIVK